MAKPKRTQLISAAKDLCKKLELEDDKGNVAIKTGKKVKDADLIDKIKEALANVGVKPVVTVKTMTSAVLRANMMAKKHDCVLLSPGATSFGLFKNEFDRGDQFKKAVSRYAR